MRCNYLGYQNQSFAQQGPMAAVAAVERAAAGMKDTAGGQLEAVAAAVAPVVAAVASLMVVVATFHETDDSKMNAFDLAVVNVEEVEEFDQAAGRTDT